MSNVTWWSQGSRRADDERISNSLDVLTLVAMMNQTMPWLLLGTFQRSFPSDIIIQQQKPNIIDPFVVAQTRTFDCVNFLHTQLRNSQLQMHSFLILILNILIECNNNNNHQNKWHVLINIIQQLVAHYERK